VINCQGYVKFVAAASAEQSNAAFGLCWEAAGRFKEMRFVKKSEILEDKGEAT
jgi:hypothetical protein